MAAFPSRGLGIGRKLVERHGDDGISFQANGRLGIGGGTDAADATAPGDDIIDIPGSFVLGFGNGVGIDIGAGVG